jgi:LacI family transcriptional regulator
VLGVIFAERIPLETLTELENKKIPFVITKEHFETYKRDFPSVCLASREAVYEQTIYLIRLGHKKIALFTGILNNGINGEGSRKMLSGYKQALEENNIAFDSSLVKESGYDTELTRKQTATLLKMAERPTAVIAADDIGAGIIINVMRENNIIVPKDISVMGTGDLDFLVAISPALTSYHIPVKEIGERAFSLLYQIIKNEKCEYPIYIQGNVITRASCAPPKM